MTGAKVIKEFARATCATLTTPTSQTLPRQVLPDEVTQVVSCREYISLLATAYTNHTTVPLYFKNSDDATRHCEEIAIDGKTFLDITIQQYGLLPGDKEYIDPARYVAYEADGKFGLQIDNHLRILCLTAADRDALRDIIWGAKKPKTIVVFANGYRNWINIRDITAENPTTTNHIYMQDNVDNGKPYWAGLDASFLSRRKAERAYYVDGHHSILTSNHNVANNLAFSKADFLYNMDCMKDRIEYFLCRSPSLHTKPNAAGFAERVANGRQAGQNLLTQLLKDYPELSTPTGRLTIDIVAHSMGFAYAQGMIETLQNSPFKNKITWGGYYILAPENAGSGTVNTAQWEQIWQYGSDLGQPDADPFWEQDGVAPQTAVGGLPDIRRAFIPKNQGIRKGFVESHSIGNYGWIFGLKTDANGYVIPR